MASTKNYDKCIAALQSHHNHCRYLNMFKSWYRAEEFEDNQLIDEFVNSNAEESFFIEHLQEIGQQNIDYFDEQEANEVFDTLQNGISTIYYTKHTAYLLISYYVKQFSLSLSFPLEIMKLCVSHMVPSRWLFSKTSANVFQVPSLRICSNLRTHEMAKALYYEQCSILPVTDEILDMFIIGVYNNELPLLIYLVDAYNRYRIQLSLLLQLRNKERIGHNRYVFSKSHTILDRNLKDFPVESFVKRVCMKKLMAITKGCFGHFKNKFVDAMEYVTNWRHFGKALLHTNNSIYVIQDSVIAYQSFICQCFTAINRYIRGNTQRMPLQIDVVIIPHTLYERGSDDNNEDECHNWDETHALHDLQTLLRSNNIDCMSEQSIYSSNCSNTIYKFIKKILDNESHRRCCILLDRYKNDLFVYKPPDANILPPNDDEFVNESLFDNSMRYLIPNFSSIGIKEEHLFSVSFHCMNTNDVRTYLYIEGFCTRFFITDFEDYLRGFFADVDEYQHISDQHRKMFKDERFNAFYDQIVDKKYEVRPSDATKNVIKKVCWAFDKKCEADQCQQYLYNNNTVFKRERDENIYDDGRIQMYTLSSSRRVSRTKGRRYHFQIRCKRYKAIRYLQQSQEIYGVGFGIRDNTKEYIFEDGDIKIDNRVYETVNKDKQWKYGQDLRMEIVCNHHNTAFLWFFVDYKRVQTSRLEIKHFYDKKFYPFLRSTNDNIVLEIQ